MRTILTLIAFFCGLSLSAGQAIWNGDLGLAGDAGWDAALDYTYAEEYAGFEGGAAVARINTGNTATGVVSLGQTYTAGTYYLWVKIFGTATTSKIDVTVGDDTEADWAPARTVWAVKEFTPTTSFSDITFLFENNNGASRHDYFFAGLYLTTNAYEAPVNQTAFIGSGMLFVDTTPVTTTNTSYTAGNLIPNSGFELGLSGGWTYGRDLYTNYTEWLDQGVVTDDKHSGTQSSKITSTVNTRYRLQSPVIRLRGVAREKKLHTFTFWAKANTTLSFTVNFTHTFTNITGYPTNELYNWSHSLTTSWARYTNAMYLSPTPTREVKFYIGDIATGANYVWLDDFQLQEGPATDYAPMHDIEFKISTGMRGEIIDTSQTKQVTVSWYNAGAETETTLNYEVFDPWNRRVKTGTLSATVEAGASTDTISLTDLTTSGTHRLVAWCDASPSYRDELVFNLIDIPATPTLDADRFWGGHFSMTPGIAATNVLWGQHWLRTLSPGRVFRMQGDNGIQITEGVFTWGNTDGKVSMVSNVVHVLGQLQDFGFPAWIGSTPPDPAKYSNHIWQIVNRYKGSITHWESLNEPQLAMPVEANYASALTQEAGAVKAADPTAKFVAMGGLTSALTASNVWNLLDATTKANIDFISCHIYPDQIGFAHELQYAPYKRHFDQWRAFSASCGKPVWHTETGAWLRGAKKGDIVGFLSGGTYVMPFYDEEWSTRAVWPAAEYLAINIVRSIGAGFVKYFGYDQRWQDYVCYTLDSNSSWQEYDDDALNSLGGMYLSIANRFPKPVLGAVSTHATATKCEAYVFQSGSDAVLAVFNIDRTNRTATITNTVDVYDMWMNRLQDDTTAPVIRRQPTFWVSTVLDTNQMHAMYLASSISTVADTTAPVISIDVSPNSIVTDSELPLRFRWTATDETDINTEYTKEYVKTRWKINGYNDWSDWSAARFTTLNERPVSGVWYLQVEAKDSAGNESTTLDGPEFGPGTSPDHIPTGGSLNVGELNVGNIR